jgi:two-component system, OmpR family, phosphate regulon sensor histidine kinase PhoR
MSLMRWFSPLSLIILAIMAAALALGVYSYHAARRLAARSEESVESSNRALGLKLRARIEDRVIDSDRTLFSMVRLEDSKKEFNELWRRITAVSPFVDTVIVLKETRELVHHVSKLGDPLAGQFLRLFMQRIVPDMELSSLQPFTHKHLHKYYDGRPYLVSFIRSRSAGRDYYVALNMNLPYISNDIFREEFRDLVDTKSIAVLDDNNHPVYGAPLPAATADDFIFEEHFPTTLYLWRLQVAPRNVQVLRGEARAQRAYNFVLVGIAVAVIVVGILVLLIAVRKERKANELKSEFVSNVTHELKTPLTLIRMFAELLSTGRSSSELVSREYAEIITRESDRLSRLIDNVLDFARIERGKAAYKFSPGDLTTVVERVVDLCQYRAEQAGVKLVTQLEPHLPQTELDEDAMTLLLFNLVENALKYGCEGGQGEITVSLARRDGKLALRVADRGPGIPREEQGRIFERFYRAKAVRSQTTRGSGIGLSLVQHIAHAHGGAVHVESDLGKGATFEVTIPVRMSEPEPSVGAA